MRMFDSIELDTVPANPEAVAGYVGGRWPTFEPLVKQFPRAHHLSIAVFASEDAECLDCEPGDATPDEVPAWVQRQIARGVNRPVVYSSVSQMPTVLEILAKAGISRDQVRLWTAHYTGTPHLCSADCGFGFADHADATQWTDRALGRNLDESLCSDTFFGHEPLHYDWFDDVVRDLGNGRSGSERGIVTEYDRERAHWRVFPRRLNRLREDAAYLADRLGSVIAASGDGASFHRDWRRQQLEGRAAGKRFT